MKKLTKIIYIFLLMFVLSSCFELREEVYIKKDGSGTYALTIDLSERQNEIDVTTTLTDSTKEERTFVANIEKAMQKSVESFEEIDGITEVEYVSDFENYLVGFNFEFANVTVLSNALGQLNSDSEPTKSAFEFKKKSFQRNHADYLEPILVRAKERKQPTEDEAINRFQKYMLETANYVFVIRSEGRITRFSNNKASYSSDEKNEVELNYSFKELLAEKPNMGNKLRIK